MNIKKKYCNYLKASLKNDFSLYLKIMEKNSNAFNDLNRALNN